MADSTTDWLPIRCGECGEHKVTLGARRRGFDVVRIRATCTGCGESSLLNLRSTLDFVPEDPDQSGNMMVRPE